MMLTSTLKVMKLLWSFATVWMVFNNIIIAKGSTCGPPTPPYGSVIIHPSVQGQHKNGSLVLFGCKQGFYLVGPPLIKCTGNTWTKIKFRCIGFCPEFRHILNGQVLHVSPKFGKAAVEFRCNEKYRLIGKTRLECINGRWNAELPFCEKLKSCERLRAPANGTLYGDDITHGAKVSFTCLTGFELFGLQTITCENGAWSGSVPSCKASCMRIRAPSNGGKYGVHFSHGSVVSFVCKPGYNLIGDPVLRCGNGKWNSTVPVCNVMLCPRPAIPSNSYIIYPKANQDSYIHGTKFFLACLDGHYLIGSPIMECNQTEWVKMDFSCIASCPVLGSIKNGIITPVTLKGGGEVKIKCRTNHTLVGSPSLICENGRWNDSLPTCGAPCDEPAIPAHGWKSNLDYRHGRSVKFYCSGKYDRIGAFSITCNDGTWDNQVPVCKARCSDPGSPSHGRKRGEIFRHNSWVEFLCNANHQLEGDQWIQCLDGSWNGPLPKCIATCPDPGIPRHGNRMGQDFRHGRTVKFTCAKDYFMEGVSEIRCSDGKWSNSKPNCKAPCGEVTNPSNGWKWGASRHGNSVRFACSRGYQRVGVVSITCNDGIWDNQAPVCKGVCGRPRIPIKGRLQGSSFLHGDEVTFSCERNYDLFGKAKLLCAGRSWNSRTPECKARCRFMGRPENGIYLKGAWRAGDMIRHGERISYRCFNGYTLIGANMQECDNGQWTNDRPACKAPCPAPDHLLHGRIIGDNFQHGSVVKFECLDDHLLQGSPVRKCDDGEWNTTMPICAACDGGLPLGMSSKAIPDSSIRASSQTDQHPAHHGRLGGNKYWCSRKERMSELRIDLPKKYKITALTIEVQDPKDISIIALLGSILQTWLQFYAQKPAFRSRRSKIAIKFPFISESLKILVVRRRKSTVCLRAEVYGCDIPRDCIVLGSPVFASNDGNDGIFFRGYVSAKAGYLLEFLNQESKKTTILPMERIFQNKKPEPVKLINGTFVLVKDSRSNQVRKGEILLVKYPLYSVKIEGIGEKINARDIDILTVVRQAIFCSS